MGDSDKMEMDGTNIFLVIVLVIIVVAMAAALLAFICTQLLPEIGKEHRSTNDVVGY